MESHTKYSADFAATTSRRRSGNNTLVIVLSILLIITLVALLGMVWIHFSPMFLHSTAPVPAAAPKHHW